MCAVMQVVTIHCDVIGIQVINILTGAQVACTPLQLASQCTYHFHSRAHTTCISFYKLYLRSIFLVYISLVLKYIYTYFDPSVHYLHFNANIGP